MFANLYINTINKSAAMLIFKDHLSVSHMANSPSRNGLKWSMSLPNARFYSSEPIDFPGFAVAAYIGGRVLASRQPILLGSTGSTILTILTQRPEYRVISRSGVRKTSWICTFVVLGCYSEKLLLEAQSMMSNSTGERMILRSISRRFPPKMRA